MNKKPNPYKPIYSVKKSSKKFQQIQKSTRKLSVENLKEQCLRLGFSLTLPQLSALYEYLFLLQKWNLSMNLVGKSHWEEILSELVADSFHLAKYLNSHPVFAPLSIPFAQKNEKIHSFEPMKTNMILLHGTWVRERDCRAFLYGYFGSKEHIPLLRQGKNVRFF